MLMEYVPFGDLLGYLRNDSYYKNPNIKLQANLTSQQLIKFAWQSVMEFPIYHRSSE